jgi:hypothetical protein
MPTSSSTRTSTAQRLRTLEAGLVAVRKELDGALGRLAAIERCLSTDAAGNVSLVSAAGLSVSAGADLHLQAALLRADTAMLKVSGVVQCDTLIANAVVAASYTPGAGNLY